MADNFDLRKFLTENKTFEKFNPIISKENLSEGDLRSKIREMILTELNPDNYDYEEEDIYGDYDDEEKDYFPHVSDLEDEPVEDYELEEAKKKKEEEAPLNEPYYNTDKEISVDDDDDDCDDDCGCNINEGYGYSDATILCRIFMVKFYLRPIVNPIVKIFIPIILIIWINWSVNW